MNSDVVLKPEGRNEVFLNTFSYLSGAEGPAPSGQGMHAASPAGEHLMRCAIPPDSTVPSASCLGVPRSIVPVGTSTNVSWTWCSFGKPEQRMPPLWC